MVTWFQLNPHNLDLSPGGSSGGEAALLAMKGSCMGMGRQVPKLHISPSTFILQTAMAEALFVVLVHSLACTVFVRHPVHSLLALSSGSK